MEADEDRVEAGRSRRKGIADELEDLPRVHGGAHNHDNFSLRPVTAVRRGTETLNSVAERQADRRTCGSTGSEAGGDGVGVGIAPVDVLQSRSENSCRSFNAGAPSAGSPPKT
eukprot:3935037-Rhodomonas_salina.1